MAVLEQKELEIAAKILKNGGILVFPTETVYGIGVVYDNEDSFTRLVETKKRPPNKPFALMCSSSEEASKYIVVNTRAKKLMDKYLPGEITFLVNARKDLPRWVTLGTDVIGIRVPDSKYVVDLIAEVGKPCLVTSANISGDPTSRYFEEVLPIFGDVVDGVVKGECNSLVPTTIVDITGDELKLVREGPVPFMDIKDYWEKLS